MYQLIGFTDDLVVVKVARSGQELKALVNLKQQNVFQQAYSDSRL